VLVEGGDEALRDVEDLELDGERQRRRGLGELDAGEQSAHLVLPSSARGQHLLHLPSRPHPIATAQHPCESHVIVTVIVIATIITATPPHR
jgi:hypothetical protein